MTPDLDPSRVRAVLFDIDGTLADTDEALIARLAGPLRRFPSFFSGRDPAPAVRRLIMATEAPANAAFALADRLGLDELGAPFLDLVHWLRGEARRRRFLLVPGVRQALEELAAQYPLGVVSTRDQYGVRAFLDQFDLGPLFGCVASARTCRRTKPHPAPVLWAADQLGMPPEACLMVGDTTVDIRAGRSSGAQTVGVLSGFGERAELERAGANLILRSTTELPGVLLHK
jgi:phosphoglycolate phosphatase-like HAD superfamily hydrolase